MEIIFDRKSIFEYIFKIIAPLMVKAFLCEWYKSSDFLKGMFFYRKWFRAKFQDYFTDLVFASWGLFIGLAQF